LIKLDRHSLLFINNYKMNDLERRCWEDYQKNLPKGLGEHNERIIKILD